MRENLKIMVPVTTRIEGRDPGSTVADVRSKIDKAVTVPLQRVSQREGAVLS